MLTTCASAVELGLPAVALPALNGSNAVGPEALSASAAEFVAGLYARDLLAYRALQESLA